MVEINRLKNIYIDTRPDMADSTYKNKYFIYNTYGDKTRYMIIEFKDSERCKPLPPRYTNKVSEITWLTDKDLRILSSNSIDYFRKIDGVVQSGSPCELYVEYYTAVRSNRDSSIPTFRIKQLFVDKATWRNQHRLKRLGRECDNKYLAIDSIFGKKVTVDTIYIKCERCGDNIPVVNSTNDSLKYILDGDILCENCITKTHTWCDGCGAWRYNVDISSAPIPKGNEYEHKTLCVYCYNNLFTSCTKCGTLTNRKKLNRLNGVFYCDSCLASFKRCDRCGIVVDDANVRKDHVTKQTLCVNCATFFIRNRGAVAILPRNHMNENCLFKSYYGIELETASGNIKRDYPTLFKIAHDGSITGHEYVSPVLQGDSGFDLIDTFIGSLSQNSLMNYKCGLHVHIGTDFTNPETLARILYGYHRLQEYIFYLVTPLRHGNKYCLKMCDNVTDFTEDAINRLLYETTNSQEVYEDKLNKYANGKKGRYYWLNLHSYFYRRTIEIRNHEGTFSNTAIKNWLNLHGRLIEYFVDTNFNQLMKQVESTNTFDRFIGLVKDITTEDIARYYWQKAMTYYTIPSTLYPDPPAREREVTEFSIVDEYGSKSKIPKFDDDVANGVKWEYSTISGNQNSDSWEEEEPDDDDELYEVVDLPTCEASWGVGLIAEAEPVEYTWSGSSPSTMGDLMDSIYNSTNRIILSGVENGN